MIRLFDWLLRRTLPPGSIGDSIRGDRPGSRRESLGRPARRNDELPPRRGDGRGRG